MHIMEEYCTPTEVLYVMTISTSTFNKNHLSNEGKGVLWSVNSVVVIEIIYMNRVQFSSSKEGGHPEQLQLLKSHLIILK